MYITNYLIYVTCAMYVKIFLNLLISEKSINTAKHLPYYIHKLILIETL